MLRLVEAERLVGACARSMAPEVLAQAAAIVEDVRAGGEQAVRAHAERLGDLAAQDPIVYERDRLQAALTSLSVDEQELLRRTAARIETFARAQRECLLPLDVAVDGGRAGHRWLPVDSVGAYAPGGRYPLPSSVLMTVVPARVAGVEHVVVASPKPTAVTLAAAAVAGADRLLAVGGAQAIAALAFGVFARSADVVVGPGNCWVTAAKKVLVGEVGIDGLAGPSELLVIADESADAEAVAADLLAQAEHDQQAVPVLVATSARIVQAVQGAIETRLATLPAAVAAVRDNGVACIVETLDEAVALANRLAPEHLELCVRDAAALRDRLTCYGGLFVGSGSAEVFGDYGAGPNHVLPTGGGARFQAGLSVASFLRPLTWLELDEPQQLVGDVAQLARLEGLEGHARAADLRA